MTGIVGAQHSAAVERILSIFHDVLADRRSRLVVVEGEPGSGKTRVVQELFALLAEWERDVTASDFLAPWWPSRMTDSTHGLLQERSAVRPLRSWSKEARSSQRFGWIGISCDLDAGRAPVPAIVQSVEPTRYDNEGLLVGHGRIGRSLRRWVGVAIGLIGLLVDVIAIYADSLFLLVLGFTLIVVGTWEWIGRWRAAWRDRQRDSEARRRVAEAATVGVVLHHADMLHAAEAELFKMIQAMVSADAPVVVLVDDAAWADDGTIDLVERVLSHEIPVLVVATVQPAHLGVAVTSEKGFGRIVLGFPGKLDKVDLPPLSQAETARMVWAELPHTDEDLVEMIARWADGNPLVVKGLLALDSIQGSVFEGRLDMSVRALAAELEETPPDVQGVFRRHWKEVPVSVRKLLAIAAEFRSSDVLPHAALRAYIRVTGDTAFAASEIHHRARHPLHWLEQVSDWVDRFADPVLLRIARDHDVFDIDDLAIARGALVEVIAETVQSAEAWNALDLRAQRLVSGLHVIAVQEGFAPLDSSAVTSAVRLSESETAPQELNNSLEHAELAEEWALHLGEEDQLWRARRIRAKALLDLRHVDDAVEVFKNVLDHYTQTAPDDPVTQETRVSYAEALPYAGRPDLAVAELEPLLSGHDDHGDALNPIFLRAQRIYGSALRFQPGGGARSVAELERLVDLHRALDSGIATAEGLQALHSLGISLRQVGRTRDALVIHEELITHRTHLLGEAHPETLKSLSNRAIALRHAGHILDATQIHRDLVERRTDVLGPLHASTLVSRNNVGMSLHYGGRDQEAIEVISKVLQDRLRTLTPESNTATLISRGALGDACKGAGLLHQALEQYVTVRDLRIKRLGPSHNATRTTLRSIAETKTLMGHPREARVDLGAILDLEQHAGDERDRANTMHLLGLAQRELGYLDEALAWLQAAGNQRDEILGPDSPLALESRTEIALTLAALDELDHATTSIQEVNEQCHSSRIDVDHPARLGLLIASAMIGRMAGAHLGAARVLSDALALAVSASGEGHPRVVRIRLETGLLSRAAGDIDHGNTQLRRALAIAEASFDSTHQVTRRLKDALSQ